MNRRNMSNLSEIMRSKKTTSKKEMTADPKNRYSFSEIAN